METRWFLAHRRRRNFRVTGKWSARVGTVFSVAEAGSGWGRGQGRERGGGARRPGCSLRLGSRHDLGVTGRPLRGWSWRSGAYGTGFFQHVGLASARVREKEDESLVQRSEGRAAPHRGGPGGVAEPPGTETPSRGKRRRRGCFRGQSEAWNPRRFPAWGRPAPVTSQMRRQARPSDSFSPGARGNQKRSGRERRFSERRGQRAAGPHRAPRGGVPAETGTRHVVRGRRSSDWNSRDRPKHRGNRKMTPCVSRAPVGRARKERKKN